MQTQSLDWRNQWCCSVVVWVCSGMLGEDTCAHAHTHTHTHTLQNNRENTTEANSGITLMILILHVSVSSSSPTSPYPDYRLGVGQWGSPNMCFQLVPWAARSSFHQINVGPAVKRGPFWGRPNRTAVWFCAQDPTCTPPPSFSHIM